MSPSPPAETRIEFPEPYLWGLPMRLWYFWMRVCQAALVAFDPEIGGTIFESRKQRMGLREFRRGRDDPPG